MKQDRDFTRYIFNGDNYGKGRLVLAIIKRYVKDHPRISNRELKIVFPNTLQSETSIQFSSTQVVFSIFDEIEPNESKRFFINEDDIILLADCKIAVSREWNVENIQTFIQAATALGYKIVTENT